MNELLPIIRRVRRPLVVPAAVQEGREDRGLKMEDGGAESTMLPSGVSVSGAPPETTRGTRVLPITTHEDAAQD